MTGDIGSWGGKSTDGGPCAGAVLAKAGSIGNNCFQVFFREHWNWQVGHRESEPGTCWGWGVQPPVWAGAVRRG